MEVMQGVMIRMQTIATSLIISFVTGREKLAAKSEDIVPFDNYIVILYLFIHVFNLFIYYAKYMFTTMIIMSLLYYSIIYRMPQFKQIHVSTATIKRESITVCECSQCIAQNVYEVYLLTIFIPFPIFVSRSF